MNTQTMLNNANASTEATKEVATTAPAVEL